MMSTSRLHDRPLISVIIPCFNQGRFLADAISSVQRQTYSSIEIIVIDDGSSDDTEKVARSFVNVQYYWQTNAGLSAARNAGISRSNGSYLVFLDADAGGARSESVFDRGNQPDEGFDILHQSGWAEP